MFGYRTPSKELTARTQETKSPKDEIEELPGATQDKAGPSKIVTGRASQVRKSVGEIESRAVTKRQEKTTSVCGSPNVEPKQAYVSRLTEAKAQAAKARLQMSNSRNLKSEIKTEVLNAVGRLLQLVKDAEEGLPYHPGSATEPEKAAAAKVQPETTQIVPAIQELMLKLEDHKKVVEECREQTVALAQQLKQAPLTYANVLAGPPPKLDRNRPAAMHTVVVSSTDELETGEEVLERIRKVVNATDGGVRVERVRKGKDRKIIMGCTTKEDLDKVKERLVTAKESLKTEEVKNKDPLVILKDVLNFHTNEDILKALKNQNPHHFKELEAEERVEVKYRRRARNPHMAHIVLKVSPTLWNRLTAAGAVHLDLQKVRVYDQSPLIQCTRCLAYGHGRSHCEEEQDACSHCGGQHLKAKCQSWLAGEDSCCRNCKNAKLDQVKHNAFSNECPIRIKWDHLARSAVAYC